MKQKFRKGKPPLRIFEKGDMRPKKVREPIIVYIAPDGSKLKRLCDMTATEQESFRMKAIKNVLEVHAKNIAAEVVKSNSIPHGQPVKVKTGEHAGETAVVIGPSKTLPGRLGVLTLGGLVHYKPEDLEVEK